eukprot:CAMPEP_0197029336 /NCGR_PEP_ID=MMETSP1384-20130603/8803_1 /TAXON_ID=29189 /ORGANISM="Ammonia sp." /LENGTH=55 /DNA_ID=CAMNT_0042458477 /DNA_START=170 /DNA_END=337 /DNA_ORIENTATION=+
MAPRIIPAVTFKYNKATLVSIECALFLLLFFSADDDLELAEFEEDIFLIHGKYES